MKKLLSILLAVLTVFSFCSIAAAAEDVTEPETEPAETFNTYEICEDPDFLQIQYMAKGNAKATLLQPGDKITTYKNSDIDVLYYPDADAMYNGDWEPADPNNIAVSPSAAEYFKETFKKKVGEATIRGIGDATNDGAIDFMIAYPEENVFLGWVVYAYEPSLNTIKLCAVWEKNHKVTTNDNVDDMYYIMDFFFSIRKAMHNYITIPTLKAIRTINNAILFVKTWLYNLIFGEETAV